MNVYDLPEHQAAGIFPRLSEADLKALAEDIRERGVRTPVVVYVGPEGDEILDGRNRIAACRIAGIDGDDVPTRLYEGDDPVGEVVSLNIQRRHLTDSQRSMAAAALANLAHGQTAAKIQQGQNQESPIGDSRNSVVPAAILPQSEWDKRHRHPKPVTQGDAAKLLNVTKRNVERAKQVRQHGAPELVAAVEQGEVSVSAAATVAKLPEEEQRKAVLEKRVVEVAREVREAAHAKEPVVVGPPTAFRPADDVEVWDEWAERDWLLDLRSTISDARDEWVRQKGHVRGLSAHIKLWLSVMEKEDDR